MRKTLRALARKANQVALGLWLLVITFLLNGCSQTTHESNTTIGRFDFGASLPETRDMRTELSVDDFGAFHGKDSPTKLGLSADESKALGCDIQDRFDRGATLAYNFDDHQSRLALHLNIEGPSLSNLSQIQINSVMLRFTHHFQKPAEHKKEKCRIPSNIQGIIGSGYNELFLRNNFTIWTDLRNRLNLAQ